MWLMFQTGLIRSEEATTIQPTGQWIELKSLQPYQGILHPEVAGDKFIRNVGVTAIMASIITRPSYDQHLA